MRYQGFRQKSKASLGLTSLRLLKSDRLTLSCRFPAQEHVGGNAKIPSVLFYSGRGRVKAAGAETLLADNIEDAEVKGWTKAEWYVLLASHRVGI